MSSTGETGAGKSIIIGALNLVLGERADRSLIRSGSDSCSVEAVFDVTELHVNQRGTPASGTLDGAVIETRRTGGRRSIAAWKFSRGKRPGAVRENQLVLNARSRPAERTASSSTARPPR